MEHFTHVYRVEILLAAFVTFLLARILYTLRSPISKLPGPWYSRWTETVLTYHWLRGERTKYVHALHAKYGPVVRVGPNEVEFSSISAKHDIFSHKGGYLKTPWYSTISYGTFESVFNTINPDFHRRHRKLLQGPISEASLKALYPTIEDRVSLTIQRMREEVDSRGAIDVFKWWLFMATDVIGELSFGESFRMLEIGETNEYTENLKLIGKMGAIRTGFPWIARLASVLPIPVMTGAVRSADSNRLYAAESLQRYHGLLESGSIDAKSTLFTKLLKAEEDEKLPFNELVADAQTYIVAGSDTTSVTLTYLVWAVCRHPEVRETLVAELKDLPENFSEHDVRDLPYLNQVIEEVLRLHSAAPSALPRLVPPGGANIDGYWLPGGTTVCAQAYSLHRNPDIFPRPDEFDPSRWATTTKAMKDTFAPFGGGSRICIGLHLAYMEIRLATARFFRAFPNARMSKLEGMTDDDMEMKMYFVMLPKKQRCLIEVK